MDKLILTNSPFLRKRLKKTEKDRKRLGLNRNNGKILMFCIGKS